MAHKYNKVNDDDVLSLFGKYDLITKGLVVKEFGCSEHAAIREIDFLKDDQIIKRVQYGYVLVGPRSNCECRNSKPTMKCSENGVSAYCGNCGKGIK